MRKLITIGLLAFAWGVQAQSVDIKGTEVVTQTSVIRQLPLPPEIRVSRDKEVRAISTQSIERHTLTFTWQGKQYTVVNDIPQGDPVVSYQQVSWSDSPELAKAVSDAVAARAAKQSVSPAKGIATPLTPVK